MATTFGDMDLRMKICIDLCARDAKFKAMYWLQLLYGFEVHVPTLGVHGVHPAGPRHGGACGVQSGAAVHAEAQSLRGVEGG